MSVGGDRDVLAPKMSSTEPAVRTRLDATIASWRDKLLAMDRRQKLLYFKHLQTGTLEFDHASPLETLSLLASTTVPIRPIPSEQESRSTRSLYVKNKTNETLRSSLRNIDQKSNQAFADRGVWTLHIGMLMLNWVDPADPDIRIDSPVLLVPVKVEKTGADSPYVVSRTEEDITVNPVLKFKLSNDFGIEMPQIDPDDVSMEAFNSALLESISGHASWRIDPRMVLGNFTFQKEAMYQDLIENADQIAGHGMVQMLALGPDAPSSDDFDFTEPPLEGLDERRPPEEMFSILDADSSQRRCIISASDGKSFVMDGPPGTGKSQTIANVIAELMANGKTVLFVSEKAAALDVVRDRLAKEGLRHFLFELHSHSATRKEVAAELAKTLQKRIQISSHFSTQDEATLARDRQSLTDFATAMNEIDDHLSWSLFTVLGRLGQLDRGVDASLPKPRRWATLSQAGLAEVREHAAELARVWDAVAGEYSYLWRDLRDDQLGPADAREYGRIAKLAAESGEQLRSRIDTIDAELHPQWPVNAAAAQTRLDLLEALDARPRNAPVWYGCGHLDRLQIRLTDAKNTLDTIASESATLNESGVTRWRDINVDHRGVLDEAVASTAVPNEATADQLATAASTVDTLTSLIASVTEDGCELGSLLGVPTTSLTLQRAGDIARLALLAAEADRPEPQWLNTAEIARVAECMDVMSAVVEHANRRHDALRETFTPGVLELDLPGLIVRFRDTHTGLKRFSGAARSDRKLIKSVSVTGKCDKRVLAQLDEAASWQQAVGDLRRAESTHAMRLGPRYQGPTTHFDDLRAALDNARQAVGLAGMESDPTALAQQLSAQGTPSPRLIPLAQRVQETISSLTQQATSLPTGLQEAVRNELDLETLSKTLTGARAEYDSVRGALAHASSTAQRDLTVAGAASLVGEVAELLALEQSHQAQTESDTSDFGEPLSPDTDFETLHTAIENARRVRAMFPGDIDSATAHRLANCTATRSDLAEPLDENNTRIGELMSLFGATRADELQEEFDVGLDEQIELCHEMQDTASSQIENWCTAHRELQWAHSINLDSTIQALKREPRTQADVEATIEYVVLEAWVDARCAADRRLRDYKADAREDLVAEFKKLDRELVKNTKAKVVQRCNARAPLNLTSRPAQIIKREGEKKTRHKPVRELLGETSSIVQQLKPCFMMSPLSVSQYIPPTMKFDVVIFDEASQVLPEDALNCIYRGRQLVVAGDQKQLPPSDFFNTTSDESDEDNEASDFKSVLDLAKGAGGLRSLPLNWHYRSRHEDLIAYSNHRFYGGDLMTFPGAVYEADDLGVAHIKVNGAYQRGTSRDNPIEAAKIVERVAWFRANRPDDSIGVVTFSTAQADRILRAIDTETERNPDLAGLLSDHDRLDGFFVKSLENVQGDERDVILFSVGYGPDEHGKFTASFGPLNKDGGWRRLNVAITRARKRIEIVSSFTANEMPSTSNPSLLHLQRYLDFAARGQVALAQEVTSEEGAPESVFEEQVIALIRSWGYDVVSQVGVAGYRIDMAVRHPERPGEYVVGIECDGAAYHSAQTARDRDRLRQQVLEGLGWRMHRIWGLSWWRDRTNQEDRLRNAIEAAIRGSDQAESRSESSPKEDDPSSHISYEDVPEIGEREWTRPYTEYSARSTRTRDPRTLEGVHDMSEFFTNVIRVEAPIHQSLLDHRFRSAWGVSRIRVQIRKAVDQALHRAHPNGADSDGFYRLDGRGELAVRVPDGDVGKRSISQIPPDELQLAMQQLVLDAVAIDQPTLIKQTAGVFGMERVGSDIRGAAEQVIQKLVSEGVFEIDEHGNLCPPAERE